MTDRNRLIELIQDIKDCNPTNWNKPEFMADSLLANGVIVPPCKVGDTVYFIDSCTTAEDFGKMYVNFEVVKSLSFDNGFVVLKSGRIRLWEDVFLTKEDAEQALKERAGKNE